VTARIRVVHVTTTPEFVRHILIHDLRRLRSRTDATVVSAPGPDLVWVESNGVRTRTIPIRRKITPLADLRAIGALVRELRRQPVDLLHSYVPKGGLVGQIAGFVLRVPARVHSCRGLLYTHDLPAWRRHLYRLVDRITNALAHRTIYISRADRDYAVREGLCDPGKARYTGSGIDLTHFAAAALPPATRAQVRADLKIAPDAPLVLTVGRFVVDKGYRELAAAIARVRHTHPAARFVWVAPVLTGEEGALPDSLAADTGIADIVVRLAIQEDIRRLYVAADLLVHPTYREGVPRVLMEAAALGLPILASDIPGCREVLPDDTHGLFVPPRNASALADCLSAALNDPTKLESVAARAHDRVREHCDTDRVADRIWEVYQELVPAAHGYSPPPPSQRSR
jgi:glycosyltransferase involved in cell wall biosynthesis